MKKRLIPVICLFVLYLSICISGQTIEIHQIDIGTGDATLIKVNSTSGQKNILIDAGQKGASSTVLKYLKDPAGGNLGAKPYIDYVISSHYHEDHIGGFVGSKKKDTSDCFKWHGVIGWPDRQITVYAVLDKGDFPPVPGSQVFKDYKMLANKEFRRVAIGNTVIGSFGAVGSITPPPHSVTPPAPIGQNLSLGGYINLGVDVNGVPIHMRLILTNANVYDPNAVPQYYNVADTLGIDKAKPGGKKNPNNWGLAWVLEYGKFRYFTGGDMGGYNTGAYIDLETPMTTTLPYIYPAPATATGHICAFKISHHGSEHSSNEVFLDTLKATSIAFSSGPNTGFSHPTQPVLNRIDTSSWSRPNLGYERTVASYITELNFIRNYSPNKGATSGNVEYLLTNQPVPDSIKSDSTMMANGFYLYEIDKAKAGEITGDIVLEVFPVNKGILISNLSYFRVRIRNFNGGAWSFLDEFECHN